MDAVILISAFSANVHFKLSDKYKPKRKHDTEVKVQSELFVKNQSAVAVSIPTHIFTVLKFAAAFFTPSLPHLQGKRFCGNWCV